MPRFDYFMVLADRRTGSNFLEANINMVQGLTCHGEAFNPNFIGTRNASDILGLSKPARDADPKLLLDRMIAANGLHGFRFFGSHDARALNIALPDPRCAKIVLTRDPVESFVSLEIARATNQWLLRDVSRRRTQKIVFDPKKYGEYVAVLRATQYAWFKTMQRCGQSAFYIDYDDLHDLDVMNGLFAYLGTSQRLKTLNTSLKRQNPAPLSDKVQNFDELQDFFMRSTTSAPHPVRVFGRETGPVVSDYVASPASALLYLPIGFGPDPAVLTWLRGLDKVRETDLVSGFDGASLQRWKHDRPGHRSFTVLRHPVARAHAAFCDINSVQTTTPHIEQHRAAFFEFICSGRAVVSCGSQADALMGFSQTSVPDMLLREADLEDGLAVLAAQIGKDTMPMIQGPTDPFGALLHQIYDSTLEDAVADVFVRDYTAFGFRPYA